MVNKTWYEELDDPEKLYTNVTSLQLLDHIIEFYLGLHTVNAMDIPQLITTIFTDVDGIPQFINAMEAVQKKSKREKIVIQDDYMHALALKLLLQSGEYETKTR